MTQKNVIGNQNRKSRISKVPLEEIARQLDEYEQPRKTPKITPKKAKPKTESIIHPKDAYWTLESVEHNGEVYTVDLKKELLPKANFEQTIKNTEQAMKSGDFYTAPLNFHYSLFKHLHNNQSQEEIEKIRTFIELSMKKNFLTTTTRINYKKGSLDAEISHNFSLNNEETFTEKMIGKDDYIKNLNEQDLYQALLGEKNNQKINEVFNWLTNKDIHLWRLNSKIDSNDKIKVARLYSNDYISNLNCNNFRDNYYASLGVRYSIARVQETSSSAGGSKK